MTPRQFPSSSIMRSSAKYSMKNSALLARHCWYNVCKIAWPVLSAAAQARFAIRLPLSNVCPPNGR